MDGDAQVRDLLSQKLVTLTQGLPDEAQSRVRQQAYEALTRLVADEADRVRAAIANAVKDLPDVPKGLVLTLARDRSVMVAEPVILFSPLLSSEDLLALVDAAPSSGTVSAVARRPGIDETVSDAVVASADIAAIHALLDNPSAQIREAALDALAAASADHTEWQEPLVRRPVLPPQAARALSEIVATHLLRALAARTDLDGTLTARLAERLIPDGADGNARSAQYREAASRLLAAPPRHPATSHHTGESRHPRLSSHAAAQDTETAPPRQSGATISAATEDCPVTAVAEAYRLSQAGLLTEQAVLAAVRRGDAPMAAALLAVAAEVPIAVVERAATLRSAKGLVSLVWQAGFTMRAGGAVQGLLGMLAPGDALAASSGGGFPLPVEEMRWQMSFLSGEEQG